MNIYLIEYVLKAARRDRLFLSLLSIMILGSCLSVFMSSAASIEQAQFSIVFMAGSMRLLGLVGLVLFSVFFIRRSFDARDIEFLLTRPVSRAAFITSFSVGFTLLALFISIAFSAGLAFTAYNIGNIQGILYWSTGVVFEYLLIVNVAFFFAMVLSSPVAASLATLGFYILSRLMGELLYIIKNPLDTLPGYTLLSFLFRSISTLIPRLDLTVQTSWLLYGPGGAKDYVFIIAQSLAFVVMVLIATITDLRRRQF